LCTNVFSWVWGAAVFLWLVEFTLLPAFVLGIFSSFKMSPWSAFFTLVQGVIPVSKRLKNFFQVIVLVGFSTLVFPFFVDWRGKAVSFFFWVPRHESDCLVPLKSCPLIRDRKSPPFSLLTTGFFF